MKQNPTSPLKAYLATVLFVLLAAALRLWPLHILNERLVWITFFPAVMFAALYGGYKQGILAAISTLLFVHFGWKLVSPVPFLNSWDDWVVILPFIVNCVIVIIIIEVLLVSKHKNEVLNKSLQIKSRQINAMADNLPGSFIFQVKTNGEGVSEIKYMSRSVTRYLPYGFEKILSNPKLLYEIFHEDETDRVQLLVLTGIKNKVPINFDARLKSNNDTVRWGNCMAIPQNEGEPITIWDGLFTEVTERKKAEEENRLLSEVVKNMADGVSLISTKDAKLLYTNPNFEKMFGYEHNELLGKHVSMLNARTDKDPQQTAAEIIEALHTKGAWEGEVLNIRKDGSQFWSGSTVSVFEHHVYGLVWVSVLKDITASKQMAKELDAQQLYNQRLITELFIKDRDKERNRVAMELHEDINQVLSSAKLYLGHSMAENSKDAGLQKGYSLLGDAIKKVEGLYLSVNPPAVNELGFTESLQLLIDKYNQSDDMHISLVNDTGLPAEVSPELKLLIYNTVDQHLLFILHSKPVMASITIQLHINTANQLEIQISDNIAAGYNILQTFQDNFIKMQSRIGFFGGTIKKAITGDELQIVITIPLG